MRPRLPIPAWLGLLAVAAAVVYVVSTARITTSVTHFLASTEDRRLGELSARLPSSELARTIVFTVDAPEIEKAHAAADDLARALADDPEIAWVRRGADPSVGQALYELYRPVRFAMARDDPERTAQLVTTEGIAQALARLRRELAGPLAPVVKRIAPHDPWLLHFDRLRALEAERGAGPELDEGRFVTADGRGAVVLAATRHAPFDAAFVRPFSQRLDRTLADLDRRFGPDLRIERSSIHRIALWSEDVIRADVQRISIVSTGALVAVLLFFFRSLRLLLLAFLPLASGIAVGAAVTLAAFGTIHGLTVAFGATLIGVAIDYPSHLFAHLCGADGPGTTRPTDRGVWRGIFLGAATTVAGFAGLAAASFPAVREMGIFACSGVAAAVAVTRWVVVPLLPAPVSPVPITVRAAAAAERLIEAIGRRRRWGLTLVAAGIVLGGTGLGRARFEDDAKVLQRLEPDLLAEDERVRARVARADASRFVVAFGPDLDTALQRNDEAARRLRTVAEAGTFAYRSLHAFLWAEDVQRRNVGFFDDPAVPERLRAGLEAAGFVPEAFAEAFADLRAPKPILTWDRIAASEIADAVAAFRVDLSDGVALLTLLEGTDDPGPIVDAVEDLEGVRYFDQRAFLARAYRRYRERIERLVLVGLAFVALLLLARYRRIRTAAAAFGPALLAAAGALSILAWAGTSLTMLHLVSCLLVLSMGVDYGVFLAEARRGEGAGRALVGIAIACASTVLSFGLLGLSAQPALAAIGATTGLGVLLAFVFAPTTLVLLDPTP
ncbi:MAG: hypothetical protein D6705_15940 [Deltaproteobacteria bacterium]|nr:MAG: hypothetical protein D6705_15940 [Deltaproteobacteria bacterium]